MTGSEPSKADLLAEVVATLRWAYPEWDDYEDAPDIENLASLATDAAWRLLRGTP